MRKLLFGVVLLFTLSGNVESAAQRYESDFQHIINTYLEGKEEVSVPSGRVDILTATHAYEVEFAPKWKNAIGQSLWYAMQTNTKPGIVLIQRSAKEYKYVTQLASALTYAGLSEVVDFRVYPHDFPGASLIAPEDYQRPLQDAPAGKSYWITKSSKKRHNSGCRYYQQTNGYFGTRQEGVPCKQCGG